ncbi:MAG: DUF58 domain-containing protein, partial [Clostridia bacterium]|nr:DUF58 domain-containing protein [Clostridia bacterium]
VSLEISNYSLLPVSQITVFANYKNTFFKHYDVGEFQFFAPPLSKNRYEIEIRSRHAGKIDVFFKKARVFDYFGVFSLPIRMKKHVSVSFLPRVHSIEPTLRKNTYTASETNLYSQHKPGDDPAEVFAIREYVDGDKLSRVHWKLTSKQDKYMVKDYSLPINEAVLILPELVFDEGNETNLDLIDSVLEIAFSLSHTLIERKTLHAIGYYNAEVDKVCVQKIGDLDDLYSVFGEIFNTSTYYSNPVLANMDPELQQNMSHVVYISANVTEDRCNALSAGKSEALLHTVINVVGEGALDADVGGEEINWISVKKSGIASSLNEAVL